MKKIFITGGAGFIGGYICEELLNNNYQVVCVDNFSKYKDTAKSYFNHKNFRLINGDCKDVDLLKKASADCDFFIAGAAMIGGISYFHRFAYDLLAENERILASSFDAAIQNHQNGSLQRIVVLSSSMVFESSKTFPTPETEIKNAPPPISTYGFQKLACEYFARGAWEQYKLPYTVVRPFNCVGTGEGKAITDQKILSGNIELAMSHVLPDLAQKMCRGQRPLHILGDGNQVRCYTHGKDIARGVRMIIESEKAINEDFNISIAKPTTVLELARLVWKYYEPNKSFEYLSDTPFEYDVQIRVPDVSKAKSILGFEAKITIEDSIAEVCDWVTNAVKNGAI